MKAAVLVHAGQFEIREIPKPVVPEDGLVLEVLACGICGSDLRRWREGPAPGSGDVIPGHEIAGRVISVGSRVQKYNPGDRLAVAPDVHCGQCYFCERGLYNLCDDMHLIGISPGYPGGFAEQMVLTGEVLNQGIVHRIPDEVSFQEAAFAEPLSSVLAAHAKANTNLEDTVLIMGAGPIGCLHIVIAKARGARVILSEPHDTRREWAKSFDPDLVLNPLQDNVVSQVRQFTGNLGADIVICANPIAETQKQAVEAVRKGGRVVLFGGLSKADPMTTLNANLIHYGEINVVGAFSYHPSYHQQALEIIRRGLVPVDKLITHTFPLEQINEAFSMASQGEALKVMIQNQFPRKENL